MNRTIMFLFAAATALAVSAPANADYVRIGSVDVGFHTDSDMAYTRFGGRMEGLRLTASRSDIFCRSIVVQYRGGERQNVFSGRLDERRPVDVDLRGRARFVDSIRFVCRSNEYRGGKIHIAAEVGRYRDEWRRDRDWDRTWSGLFGGGMGGGMGHHGGGMMGPDSDWVMLGRESFEGRNDSESNFTGWGGRSVDRIALRPLEGDARCMSIVAAFGNGRKAKLADGRVLERGRMNVYDLPGRDRDIVKVYLRCRALNGYRVTIEILARK
jgi:hypothetical protein